MATTSYSVTTNEVTIASGATVEFTINWSWGQDTFNDWMPCHAYSEVAGVDGIYIEYRLNVLSTVTRLDTDTGYKPAIGKVIRNEWAGSDPPSDSTTTFRGASIMISG
jgi:hypothetical protein